MSTPEKSAANPGTAATDAGCQSTPNAIEWNELITPDPAAAIQFYGGLFGWTTEVFGGAGKPYTMWKHADRTFGGVMAPPMPGIPPHWLNYVSVTDLDATVVKATGLGAKVCLPPTDIGEAGRIAVLTDPQGAGFGLHEHPAKTDAKSSYVAEWSVTK